MKTLAQADREAQRAAIPGTFQIANHGTRSFRVGSSVIEYFGNGGNEPTTPATNFYVRDASMQDDVATDYWAGSFRETLTGAIRAAKRGEQR